MPNVGHPLQRYHAHLRPWLLPQCFQRGAERARRGQQKGAKSLTWRLFIWLRGPSTTDSELNSPLQYDMVATTGGPGLSVGNATVGGHSHDDWCTSIVCQQRSLVDAAAKARFEPLTDIVCEKRDVRFVP